MRISGVSLDVKPLAGAVPAVFARVGEAQWTEAARRVREAGHRLVALWGADRTHCGEGFAVHAAYALETGLCVLQLGIRSKPSYPDLSGLFPAAERMQRAVADLLGVVAEGAADTRPWLRHGAWGAGEYPLRRAFDAAAVREATPDDYPFVRVEGDGVHEIPVGPIHAGIIEPGHFRFSVVGEKVLRLEERLGYTHKGVDRRFRDFTVADGYRLAGRVSGDSTVAYGWAYAQAAESLLGIEAPQRAAWLRALMLERERVANHLGDLGALGNDVAFGFSFAQFMRLREDWLRASDRAFGHRLLRDMIVPGGVAVDPSADTLRELLRHGFAMAAEVKAMRQIFEEHSGLQDRFLTAGRVAPELAKRLGLVGLAGRASGQAYDLRADHPCDPYRKLGARKVVYQAGDVAARAHVRFDELFESLALLELLIDGMPGGPASVALPAAAAGAFGVGWVEGWRGEVLVAIEAGEGGRIAAAHAHDPSWHNWPVLEHAVMGNIVPDFPLINKSFNLSYSGVDI